MRAADHLRATIEAPRLLIGHSLGGAAVLAAAGRIAEAVGVVTIGAPFDPEHATDLFGDARADIEALGEVQVEIAGRTFLIRRQFLEDISQQNLRPAIARLKRALLVFHAPLDAIVGIDNARRLSRRRSTRRASSPSTRPTTCSPTARTPPTWPLSWRPGPVATWDARPDRRSGASAMGWDRPTAGS